MFQDTSIWEYEVHDEITEQINSGNVCCYSVWELMNLTTFQSTEDQDIQNNKSATSFVQVRSVIS